MDLQKIQDYKQFLDNLWSKHIEPKQENAPTVISLFAGGGGSSLGYSMAGYKELCAVEYMKLAYSCLNVNFPDVPVITDDIRTVSGEQVKTIAKIEEGMLDVLDMSPSCCGFSTAGNMRLDDDRNFLYKEAIRILDTLKPKVFIMENVANMKGKRFESIFNEIMAGFANSGYKTSYKVINAKNYGTATIRKRLFVVGIRNDIDLPFVFPEPIYEEIPVKDAILDLIDCSTYKPFTQKGLDYWNNAAYGKPVGKRGSERKLNPDKPSFTLVCGSGAHHWSVPRMLFAEEMKRIQGFPEPFKFKNKSQAKKIIGNSVCPPLMYVLASEVRKQILDKIVVNLTSEMQNLEIIHSEACTL